MNGTGLSSTERFSDRVADYIRYRPGYPNALVETLKQHTELGDGIVVADMGSGTGISSLLFLRLGCTVFGLEPNTAMRLAAESELASFPTFRSVNAPAEASSLPDASIDLIVAGQAFHWFDMELVRGEWQRILRPGGSIALFWNTRLTQSSPFQRALEALIEKHAFDYHAVDHRQITERKLEAFLRNEFQRHAFPNNQILDLNGLKGRLMSASYMPQAGDPGFSAMVEELEHLFAEFQIQGRVFLEYETELYWGRP